MGKLRMCASLSVWRFRAVFGRFSEVEEEKLEGVMFSDCNDGADSTCSWAILDAMKDPMDEFLESSQSLYLEGSSDCSCTENCEDRSAIGDAARFCRSERGGVSAAASTLATKGIVPNRRSIGESRSPNVKYRCTASSSLGGREKISY